MLHHESAADTEQWWLARASVGSRSQRKSQEDRVSEAAAGAEKSEKEGEEAGVGLPVVWTERTVDSHLKLGWKPSFCCDKGKKNARVLFASLRWHTCE